MDKLNIKIYLHLHILLFKIIKYSFFDILI